MSNDKRVECKFVPNNKQVQFNLVPKIQVYRTIADPKSRVEIVCAEQVVGLYVRQAVVTRNFWLVPLVLLILPLVVIVAAVVAFVVLRKKNRQ